MRCERICSLARYVIADAANPAITAATQWFERTLDDSANKRISVPEAFLAVDAILNIYLNVASGLIVHPKVIEKHIMEEPVSYTHLDVYKRQGEDRARIEKRFPCILWQCQCIRHEIFVLDVYKRQNILWLWCATVWAEPGLVRWPLLWLPALLWRRCTMRCSRGRMLPPWRRPAKRP